MTTQTIIGNLKTGAVYKIENMENGKCYYGQTTLKVGLRLYEHRRKLRKGVHENTHLQNAWVKYGEQGFNFDIIAEGLPLDQLDTLESKLITTFRANEDKFGYNKESGGNKNKVMTQEAKKKMSEHWKGYYGNGGSGPNKGRAMSEDIKSKLRSKQLRNKLKPDYKHPCEGKLVTETTRKRMSKRAIEYFKNGGRHGMSGKTGKIPKSIKPCIGPDGFIYPSVKLAAMAFGLSRGTVSRNLRHGTVSSKGLFEYLVK